jgi:hypothetical protein
MTVTKVYLNSIVIIVKIQSFKKKYQSAHSLSAEKILNEFKYCLKDGKRGCTQFLGSKSVCAQGVLEPVFHSLRSVFIFKTAKKRKTAISRILC